MSTTVGPDEEDDRPVEHIFAGLAGLELDCEEYSLGGDGTLRKTYAHLMAPFLMAFAPAPPGKHHLAPWKAASGGLGYDVLAELRVPRHIGSERATYILRLLAYMLMF